MMYPLPPMGQIESPRIDKQTLYFHSPRYKEPTLGHDDFPDIGCALFDPPPVNDWLADAKDMIYIIPDKKGEDAQKTRVEIPPVPPDVDKQAQAKAPATKTEEPDIDATRVRGNQTLQVRQQKSWKSTAPQFTPTMHPVVERSVETSIERSVTTKSTKSRKTTKTESDYPGYVDLNSCRLGDAIDALISVPIIILQIIWITMEDQESTEGTIFYWTAAGMEIYLLLELWGYVLIGEVTPMSLLSIFLIRKLRSRYRLTFMPFPDVIRRISRFMLGLSLIANTILSFWPGVNDLIPLALSVQLWLALMASAGMNQ